MMDKFWFCFIFYLQEFGDSARARKLYEADSDDDDDEEIEPNPKLEQGKFKWFYKLFTVCILANGNFLYCFNIFLWVSAHAVLQSTFSFDSLKSKFFVFWLFFKRNEIAKESWKLTYERIWGKL